MTEIEERLHDVDSLITNLRQYNAATPLGVAMVIDVEELVVRRMELLAKLKNEQAGGGN